MKKTFLLFLVLLTGLVPVKADEGMWLPLLISNRINDMQAKGFRLTAEDIYSVNTASLKDAVVRFGGGCTGEVVSPDGLLFTNHHCGYGQIQEHSTVEHDYLKDGFWAMSMEEELPNPGLTVSFLQSIIEQGLLAHMRSDGKAVLDAIRTEKALSDDLRRDQRKFLLCHNASPRSPQSRKNGSWNCHRKDGGVTT